LEALLVYDDRCVGRPLTADEGRRVVALTTKRQPGNQPLDEGRRVIATTKRQANSQSLNTASHYVILAEFTVLFVLGMFIGTAAILIAFML
jgi:hypothetical protein